MQAAQTQNSTKPTYLEWLAETLPRGWSAKAPHIKLIAEHLDAVDAGQIDRLAIHMPPRHGKTETVTARYPVKWLGDNPESNVLLTAYNERFARRLGRKTRNLAIGRLDLDESKQAADEWATSKGGVLMTRGVGSPPTGVGFGRIIIDDPIRKREDADSETYREKTWDWYTDDLSTRLEPGGAIVLIATLWHHDDVCARAVASEPGKWTVLKLPAIAESEGDALGRHVGEALWPERWPVEELDRRRAIMLREDGEKAWESLYQQNPTPREGSMFKVAKLHFASEAPKIVRRARAWDLAASVGSGDFSVGLLIGVDGEGQYWVLDVQRGQWGPDERRARMVQVAQQDGPQVPIRFPQDPGQAGKEQVLSLTRMLAGYSVSSAPVTGSKEVRAEPVASQVNMGNVTVIRAGWNSGFVEEMRTFPGGKHDDMVDALSDGFAMVAGGGRSWDGFA